MYVNTGARHNAEVNPACRGEVGNLDAACCALTCGELFRFNPFPVCVRVPSVWNALRKQYRVVQYYVKNIHIHDDRGLDCFRLSQQKDTFAADHTFRFQALDEV